ncbi:FAD:protein FMN transferase [Clostridium culturomicium]|uniref:FAD:protein FMN transferase n=1 Tax=Clostridium culturomicium TaxID=1499683 RepID=UPI00058F5F26|nr:FAD:protein FMN transferase [Clostridium culturomicium]
MKNLKKLSCFLAVLMTITILAGCSKSKVPAEPTSKTALVLGTVCTITLYDSDDTEIIDKAIARLSELEDILSINKTGTELDLVNDMSGIEPVKVSKDTLTVVKEGLKYSKLSNGTMDITVGPLVKLWGIGTEWAAVPTQEDIETAKSLINYEDVVIDEANSTIYLKKPGMKIDLGAIAKGYAADEVAKLLKDNSVKSAIVNLGGNIFVLGNKVDGSDWKVGVQNPENDGDSTIGYVTVTDKSVVTSGIYERYFEEDGKKYHHILSPETGFPYENEILGVSILSDLSIDGDSLSTTLFALGVEEGLKLIESLEGVDAIFVTKDHKLHMTKGFEEIFTLTNTDYSVAE